MESYGVVSSICQAMLPGRRRGGVPSARDAPRLRLRGSGCGMAREKRRARLEGRAGERDDRGGGRAWQILPATSSMHCRGAARPISALAPAAALLTVGSTFCGGAGLAPSILESHGIR